MLRLEIGGEKYILTYGKSIELFLVNGTADSLITAELSNWNGKAIKIPRIEVASCNRIQCLSPAKKYKLYKSSINKRFQCLSPAKKYKLYKSSINKSIHFVQRSLSSSTRGQRVTAQLNLSRE